MVAMGVWQIAARRRLVAVARQDTRVMAAMVVVPSKLAAPMEAVGPVVVVDMVGLVTRLVAVVV
jgi:hypothetical protein